MKTTKMIATDTANMRGRVMSRNLLNQSGMLLAWPFGLVMVAVLVNELRRVFAVASCCDSRKAVQQNSSPNQITQVSNGKEEKTLQLGQWGCV
jgi:hypothetical protein